MKIKLLSVFLIFFLANTSCNNNQRGKQACDGPGPCNYPNYVDVPILSEKDLYCKFTVVKRIDCSIGGFAFDCDDVVCIECSPKGATCVTDSTDNKGDKFLKIKYKKDDYVLKLGSSPCGVCTLEGVKHIYKEK